MNLQAAARRFSEQRFLRFLMVGVINTAFGYGVFWLLLYIGLHYSMAALLGTVLAVLFNFKSTGTLVFRSRDNRLIVRFAACYGLMYLCNLAGLTVLVHAGLSPQVAGAALLLPMAMVSYVLQKTFVFQPR